MRGLLKTLARGLALIVVSPALLSFVIRRQFVGADRALHASTQTLSLIPGLTGQYLRRAFLSRTLLFCGPNAVIEFGVLFSQCGARIDDYAYVGPRCHLGLVHIEEHAMLAAGVHVPSGARTHGTRPGMVMRDQATTSTRVVIGRGAWIGSNVVVMADVGKDTIVGAGAVVVRPLPDHVMAAGVPAVVVKQREQTTPA